MADEEVVEGADEAAVQEAGELIPDAPSKPQNDVFTLLLVLAFAAFLVGTFIVGYELHDFYDVQFFIFGKK